MGRSGVEWTNYSSIILVQDAPHSAPLRGDVATEKVKTFKATILKSARALCFLKAEKTDLTDSTGALWNEGLKVIASQAESDVSTSA